MKQPRLVAKRKQRAILVCLRKADFFGVGNDAPEDEYHGLALRTLGIFTRSGDVDSFCEALCDQIHTQTGVGIPLRIAQELWFLCNATK